jgi:hypothetical protein
MQIAGRLDRREEKNTHRLNRFPAIISTPIACSDSAVAREGEYKRHALSFWRISKSATRAFRSVSRRVLSSGSYVMNRLGSYRRLRRSSRKQGPSQKCRAHQLFRLMDSERKNAATEISSHAVTGQLHKTNIPHINRLFDGRWKC